MNDEEIILGPFYSDEDNLVFDNIKCSDDFSFRQYKTLNIEYHE